MTVNQRVSNDPFYRKESLPIFKHTAHTHTHKINIFYLVTISEQTIQRKPFVSALTDVNSRPSTSAHTGDNQPKGKLRSIL